MEKTEAAWTGLDTPEIRLLSVTIRPWKWMCNIRCQVRITLLESCTPEHWFHSWRLNDIVFKFWLPLDSCPRTLSPTRPLTFLTWTWPPQQQSVHRVLSGLRRLPIEQMNPDKWAEKTKSKSPRLDPINVWNILQCYQDEKEIKRIKVREDWHRRSDLTLPPDQKTERVQHQK